MADGWDAPGRRRRRRHGEDDPDDPFPLPALLGDPAPPPRPGPPPTHGEGWVRLDGPASPAAPAAPRRAGRERPREQHDRGSDPRREQDALDQRHQDLARGRDDRPPAPRVDLPGPAYGPGHGTSYRSGGVYEGDPAGPDPFAPDPFGPDPFGPAPFGAAPPAPGGLGPGGDPGGAATAGPGRRRGGRRGRDDERDDGDDGSPTPARPPARGGGPLLPVLLLVLLAWLAGGFVRISSPGWPAALLAELEMLSPLVSVVAVPVIGLALRRRRWITTAGAAVAAAAPWVLVLGYVSSAPPLSGAVQPLRILVVNAHNGDADAPDIVEQARAQAVDVLVVTELSAVLAHDLTADGIDATLTPVSVTTGSPEAAGLGVYSRFAVSDVHPLPGTRWPAVQGVVDTGHGSVTLIAAHVVPPTPSTAAAWATDLDVLRRDAAAVRGPVVVAGTLNATPWNPQFRALATGRLHDAADLLGRGLRPTWPSWLPLPVVPLEHVLAGGGLGVTSVGTAPIGGSDHRALVADLTLHRR